MSSSLLSNEQRAYLLLIDQYSSDLDKKFEELQQLRLLYSTQYLPDLPFYSNWLTDIIIQIQKEKLLNGVSWHSLILPLQELYQRCIVDCPDVSLSLDYIDGM